jgi:hypothetical protein
MVSGVKVSNEGIILRVQYPIIKNFKTITQAPEHFFCVHNTNELANVPERKRGVKIKKKYAGFNLFSRYRSALRPFAFCHLRLILR